MVCGPLQLFYLSFMCFWTVGLSDPIRCVLKHGTGHAVLNVWAGFVSRIYLFIFIQFIFFPFRDTNCDTLVFLRPETRHVATRVSRRK